MRPNSRLLTRFLALAMILVLIGSAGAAAAQGDNLVADSGFRPDVNGFSFPNYGNESGVTNLTAVEMVRLYGPSVCIGQPDEQLNCKLSSPATMYMNEVNEVMNGGHCEGMAVLSGFIYDGTISASLFGEEAIAALQMEGNEALQREIALWFTTQAHSTVKAAIFKGAPSEILNKLAEAWEKKEVWALGFYKRDGTGGHATLPYAIRDVGDGIFELLHYDNNYPNEERVIRIDTNNETWEYNGSPNPDIEPDLYEGDAETLNLEITPHTSRTEPITCDFCSGGGNALHTPLLPQQGIAPSPGTKQIDEITFTPNGRGNVVVTDPDGKRTGVIDGKVISEIPNARVILPKNAMGAQRSPSIVVPAGRRYSFSISKVQGANPATSVSIVRRGVVLAARKFNLDKGAVTITVDGNKVSVNTPGGEKVVVQQGSNVGGKDVSVAVTGTGANFSFTPTSDGKVRVDGDSGQPVELLVTYTDPDGKSRIYHADDFTFRDDVDALLDPSAWGDKLDIRYVDDNDNVADSVSLDDDPLNEEDLKDFGIEDDYIENFDDNNEFDDSFGDDPGDAPDGDGDNSDGDGGDDADGDNSGGEGDAPEGEPTPSG